MNYFELHIGDYQRKTAHLTLAEHGAYSLMLQTFYATERALPTDRKVLYRLLRADSVAERKAVDSVVAQFWQETAQGLINNRATEVLDAYRRWVEQQKANGKRGGRRSLSDGLANGKQTGSETETQTKPNGVPMGGDRARVPLPTSHLDHDQDSQPTPTPPRGGAARQRRSPRRAELDEARCKWRALLQSGGVERDARVQAAINAVGGWPRIAQRTQDEEPRLVREFCDAYQASAA